MIKREIGNGNRVHISKINSIIKWTVRIPLKYKTEVVKEMVRCGLLERVDRDNYELPTIRIKSPIDSNGNPLWQ